jgi:hypothetical protein
MSTLEALLIFAGIPLLITVVIVLLVYAPSLARGSQHRSSAWTGQPELFVGAGASSRALPPGSGSEAGAGASHRGDQGAGGASAQW